MAQPLTLTLMNTLMENADYSSDTPALTQILMITPKRQQVIALCTSDWSEKCTKTRSAVFRATDDQQLAS
ncbi:hypothetical protein MHH28_28880 [Paenibacillus sp. FSL K6-1217]|uniref:hypothetical protein n=1 Tax=Paenibacillus sp. FSL K6-1217 TaxID=2921466 RepID=UPI00324E9D69